MTVYPDLAFFVGLILHGAVFRLGLLLLDLRRPLWIFCICTFCSGISSAMLLIPYIPPLFSILIGIGGAGILFLGKSVQGTMYNLLTCFCVTVLYLGGVFVFSGSLFPISLRFDSSGGHFLLSFFATVISAVLSFLFGRILVKIQKKRKGKIYCDCGVSVGGAVIPFRAYVDTGNFLTDPVSGFPVVILEFSLLQKKLGADFPKPMTYEFASYFGSKARVIPYRSVSGDGRMLSAFVPELFTVNGVPQRVVIGVSDRKLENRGRFSGIIGPNLTEGE